MAQIRRAAVIGAGIMGHGIAQLFAQAKIRVCLTDNQPDRLTEARRRISDNLNLFVEHDVLSQKSADEAQALIGVSDSLYDAIESADFVTECVTEDLRLKQSIFEEVGRTAPAHAILATNTSSLPVAEIGIRVKDPSRLLVTHYFNPPHIVPIVEVAPGASTDPAVVETTLALMRRLGKLPVCLKKSLPGFVVNRIQAALAREVLSLLDQEVATPEEIDLAVRGVIGFRLASLGPLEVMDFGGLDTWLEVARNLFPEINCQTDVPSLLLEKVEKGELGMKSGQGFYQWKESRDPASPAGKIRQRDKVFLRLLHLLYGGRQSGC
jgi:3-hydroxybutyryl-CoA dehydrogenase